MAKTEIEQELSRTIYKNTKIIRDIQRKNNTKWKTVIIKPEE